VTLRGSLPVTIAAAVLGVALLAVARATSETSPPAPEPTPFSPRRPPRDPLPLMPGPLASEPARLPFEPVRWRQSRSLGLPWAGRLEAGVQLPREGRTFFTWDPVLRRSPSRAWRQVGSDRLVRTVLRVLGQFAHAHPHAPRIGIGDLSRPAGGDFGIRYGRPGHVSHQNGLDVDLYYPRLDRRERPPRRVAQIDRRLAQELVDRFVRAGASHVFVGPGTGLTGPPRIVQPLAHHDNHLHVRLR